MQRIDQLLTQMREYIKQLQFELDRYDPATDEYSAIKEELDHIEWYMEYTLSLGDEATWSASPIKHSHNYNSL